MGDGGLNAVWGGALKGSLRIISMIGIFAPLRFLSLRVARFANIRAAFRFVRIRRVLRLTTVGSGRVGRGIFRTGVAATSSAGATVSTTTVLELASSSIKGTVVSAAGAADTADCRGGPAAGFGEARTEGDGGATNRYVPAGGSWPRDSGLGEAGDADPRLAAADGRLGAGAGVLRLTLRFTFIEGGGAAEGFALATGGINGRGELERGTLRDM